MEYFCMSCADELSGSGISAYLTAHFIKSDSCISYPDALFSAISSPERIAPVIWVTPTQPPREQMYRWAADAENTFSCVSSFFVSTKPNIRAITRLLFVLMYSLIAQYAFNLGVPDGIIDYCLGHSDKRRGVIRFYAKVRKQQADAAIAKVIDYVNNPEKYEDYLKLKRDIMMMQV